MYYTAGENLIIKLNTRLLPNPISECCILFYLINYCWKLYLLMVKYSQRKEDGELSTSQSICYESDIFPSETLSNIIDKMPKLTSEERRRTSKLSINEKNSSRKWSQQETKQFYELVRHFGLDFTLISYHPYFCNRRSQKELSTKYKKESKKNPCLIKNVLNKIEAEGLYSKETSKSGQWIKLIKISSQMIFYCYFLIIYSSLTINCTWRKPIS